MKIRLVLATLSFKFRKISLLDSLNYLYRANVGSNVRELKMILGGVF